MFEIRFHGRGGQGTVLAAKMLADAVLRSGRGECLAIPEFGVERRGAPVVAYARISDHRIRSRTRIYRPDAVVVLDPTLISSPAVTAGLKPGGILLLNSEAASEDLAARWPGFKVRTVPAQRLALANKLGSPSSPLVNTAMLGAMTAVFGLVDWGSVEAAIRDAVPAQVEANVDAAREAMAWCWKEEPCAPA